MNNQVDTETVLQTEAAMPISDQSDSIKTVKSGQGKKCRTKCVIISVLILLILGAAVACVFIVPGWKFWEKEEEIVEEPIVEKKPEPQKSWQKCGLKSLLEVEVTDEFGTKSDPCVLGEGESPFVIMIYRSAEDF